MAERKSCGRLRTSDVIPCAQSGPAEGVATCADLGQVVDHLLSDSYFLAQYRRNIAAICSTSYGSAIRLTRRATPMRALLAALALLAGVLIAPPPAHAAHAANAANTPN
ncbi:hypothetical protein GCM10009733_097140 [Nonomuraea maheshkhaliensis]|uniref:Uncharacterized protein n=1 Tax=Nonomuraea maheshkhaliensis TaxID=419590 RepID=A0ABP4TAD8_9ACTN